MRPGIGSAPDSWRQVKDWRELTQNIHIDTSLPTSPGHGSRTQRQTTQAQADGGMRATHGHRWTAGGTGGRNPSKPTSMHMDRTVLGSMKLDSSMALTK